MSLLVLATYNAGKVREFREIMPFESHVSLVSLADLACRLTVIENGQSFYENAKLKAEAAYQATQQWCLADDSGLEVDALGGAPGIYSARYAGESSSDQENMALLLQRLQHVPEQDRTARFRCVLCLGPGTQTHPEFVAEGICEGRIEFQPKGTSGFGYDPIFVPSRKEFEKVGENSTWWDGKTLAEIPPFLKNAISHRAQALVSLLPILKKI